MRRGFGDDTVAGMISSPRHAPLTSTAAGQILGVSPMRIRQLAQSGLIGTKVGTQWLFTLDELQQYRRDSGRIAKKTKKVD